MRVCAPLAIAMVAALAAFGPSTAWGDEPAPLPKVRAERPRVFLRAKAWDGPSIERIRGWMDRPEYKAHWTKLLASELAMNQLLRYVLTGDAKAGRVALDRYMSQVGGGTSPSYWGIKDQRMAALYDWLHDHPDFTPEKKAQKLAQLERRCLANMDYLKNVKENPFYSRYAGALGALTACALAIHGDSPRADEFLRFAFDCLRGPMGTIRQAEDGSTGGACYGYHHEFTDLANTVAAWRSATDWDAADWIGRNQGDWLRRQMLFQIWMTYPNGRFVKDGDVWGRDTADDRQYRMHIDAITGMYRDGTGRSWADEIHRRWGVEDYHSEYLWQFFVFNDPQVKPRPLGELARTAAFSPDLLGMVCWRSDWSDEATIVHFRAGESGDTHATWDQGKFIIYRRRPLAIKNGAYMKFMDPHHQYYKSPSSANCVVFGTAGPNGMAPLKQPRGELTYGVTNFKFSHNNPLWPQGLFGWQQWQKLRSESLRRDVMGRLLSVQATDRLARASADLSYVLHDGEARRTVYAWRRELVFLDYKYLLVLDRVRGDKDEAGNPVAHAWTLHTTFQPRTDGPLAVADNGPARLFCRTLLPAGAKLTAVGGPGRECDVFGRNPLPPDWKEVNPEQLGPHTQMGAWRLDVAPAPGSPEAAPGAECIYLHVLFPTEATTERMPDCSVRQADGRIIVSVGGLDYEFTGP